MKKIININLSGRIIPIEDTAYEGLQRYLESLRSYFTAEEGRDEIINDIESRISELMSEKIRKGASAITDADIKEIMAIMGRVEDFKQQDEQGTGTNSASASAGPAQEFNSHTSGKGRLYRNASDKLLGGVCSGIAGYMNFDPAIVRLLFAIITLGAFGIGLLIYIGLWVLLPVKEMETYVGKKFFRNPDDRIIAGVCGGLAAYFNSSSKTVRLVFAAPVIINIIMKMLPNFSMISIAFGSLTTTFVIAYIILWILLPLARSPYDKMEMRGEKIDVSSIRQNVKENMNDFANRAEAWGEEVKETAEKFRREAGNFADTKSREWRNEMKPAASGLGHVLASIIKGFFLFIAGITIFCLFVILMVLIFAGGAIFWPLKETVFDLLLNGMWQIIFFWLTLLFFFILPLFGFIMLIFMKLIGARSSAKNYMGWTLAAVWIIGWISLAVFASMLGGDFRSRREISTPVHLSQPAAKKMVISAAEPQLKYSGNLFLFTDDINGIDLTEDSLKIGWIHLHITATRDTNFSLQLLRSSFGPNPAQAGHIASLITYPLQSKDSFLELGNAYAIAKADKFRGQTVTLDMQIPIGRKVRFDDSLEDILDHVCVFETSARHKKHSLIDHDDHYSFKHQPDTDYIMTEKGLVQDESSYL